jgi:hypothetical protein
MKEECRHIWTKSRSGVKGSWCTDCGQQIYAVDDRECRDCKHYSRLPTGSVCSKHLMVVTPDMHVTFKIAEGTCWEAADSEKS